MHHHFESSLRAAAIRARRALVCTVLATAGAGGFVAGCGTTSGTHLALAGRCSVNSDCESPLVCTFGLCHEACKQTEDCSQGERCVKIDSKGVCELETESSCTYKSDCPDPLTCAVDRQCRVECQGVRDCLANQVCASGSCADQNEVDSTGQLRNAQSDGGNGIGGNSGTGGDSSHPGSGGAGTDRGGSSSTSPDAGIKGGPGGFGGVPFGGSPNGGAPNGGLPNGGGGFINPGCGSANQPCCPGQTCNDTGTSCIGGVCTACGALNGTCCPGDTCSSAGTTCSGGTCVSCGALSAPCCGSTCNATLTCTAGSCTTTCAAPLIPDGADCVVPAPRPIGPLSGSFMNTRVPKLSWALPSGITTAHLEVCSDRACATVLYSADVTGTSAIVGKTLPRGAVFWRLRGAIASDAGSTSAVESPVWQLEIGGTHDAPKSAAWGAAPDFNGDGIADLLVMTTANPSAVEWFAGSALGLSSSPVTVGASGSGGKSGFIVGDIDGDGYVDLLLPSGGGVDVYPGSSTGFAATPSQSLQIKQDGSTPESIGDVNGDGYGDLIVPSEVQDADNNSDLVVNVYHGGPSGLSITPQTLTTALLHQPPFANSDTGDVNADGYADVMISSSSGGTSVASVFYGSATGLSAARTDITIPSGGGGGNFLVSCIGDVNGDGYVDMAALGSSTYVYFGGASGMGTSPTTLTGSVFGASPGRAWTLGLGDTNGDGFSDFVVSDTAAPNLRLYLGSATGVNPTSVTLAPPAPSGFTVSRANVDALSALGDVDGDGVPDFAVAIDWMDLQNVQKHQIDVFSGKNTATPNVLSFGANALR